MVEGNLEGACSLPQPIDRNVAECPAVCRFPLPIPLSVEGLGLRMPLTDVG